MCPYGTQVQLNRDEGSRGSEEESLREGPPHQMEFQLCLWLLSPYTPHSSWGWAVGEPAGNNLQEAAVFMRAKDAGASFT